MKYEINLMHYAREIDSKILIFIFFSKRNRQIIFPINIQPISLSIELTTNLLVRFQGGHFLS